MKGSEKRKKKKGELHNSIRQKECIERRTEQRFFNYDKSDEGDLVIVWNLLSYSFPRR